MNSDPDLLRAAARGARLVGESDLQFAEVSLDQESFTLTVFRVPPQVDPGVDLAAAYRAALPAGASLIFSEALVSAEHLRELNALVEESFPDFEAAGYPPTSWGTDELAGPFVIDFPTDRTPPESVLRRFRTDIDAGRVRFRTQRAVPLTAPVTPRDE